MKNIFSSWLRAARTFRSAQRGNVAITFAIAALPVIGLMGAAVDFSRGNAAKTSMQAALDSTALMLSKNAATLTSAQLQAQALSVFTALFNNPTVNNLKITAAYSSTGGSSLLLNGTGTMPTNFVGILGYSTLDIAAKSTTAWGTSKLRVALVLDNSGSMDESGKMTALKTATRNLLTTLQNASSTPGDVQVAIIPYTNDVNVGTGNVGASWLSWTEWDAANGSNTCSSYDRRGNCTDYDWTPSNHSRWNGCVTDRGLASGPSEDFDVKNTAPSTSKAASMFAADQSSYCPVSLMPLNYNWSTLASKVTAMDANGATNGAIGLVWGWHALSQSAPLSAPALPTDYTTTQVIIMLTDGLNTQDRWYGNGTTWQTRVDARQTLLCNNIKAAGIQIYTILVMDGNDDLLRSCASDADHYFNLTNANQIVTTFDAIGTNLSRLRVAK